MTDPSDGEFVVDRLPPDEAFELVADETRVRILEALADAERPLSFSDLRDRADVDDPGRFNYHLGRLDGPFVQETPDGYELGVAGLRLVGAVLSGSYTKSFDGTSFETDAACPRCQSSMEAEFDGELAILACPACDVPLYRAAVPPGAFAGRDPADIPRVIDRYQKRRALSNALGFCTFCDGPLDHEIRVESHADAAAGGEAEAAAGSDDEAVAGSETEPTAGSDDEAAAGSEAESATGSDDEVVALTTTCERCGVETQSVVEAALFGAVEVMRFHADHGIDLLTEPIWELPWIAAGGARVERSDPLRVRVPVTLDDETLHVTLDGNLAVVETRRS